MNKKTLKASLQKALTKGLVENIGKPNNKKTWAQVKRVSTKILRGQINRNREIFKDID